VDLAPAPAPGPNPTARPPPTRPPSTSRPTPQQTAPPRSAPVSGPSPSTPQINCFCGKPSVELTVKKESANKGRQFRRCGQPESSCDFFEWTDEPPRDRDAGMKRAGGGSGGGPPNPPSIPAKRSRTDDAVRVFHISSSTSFHPTHLPIRPQGDIVSVTSRRCSKSSRRKVRIKEGITGVVQIRKLPHALSSSGKTTPPPPSPSLLSTPELRVQGAKRQPENVST
jgi:hypothetical protein